MQLPNPYANPNYKYLVVLPLVLLAVAAFFIPRVPAGVDLKGGLLLTVQTSGPVEVAALKDRLASFSESVQVRQFQSPAGQGLEIELSLNPAMEKADVLVKELRDLNAQLSAAEIDEGSVAAQPNATIGKPAAVAGSKQLNEAVRAKTGELFALLKIQKAVPADGHDAFRLADAQYSEARLALRDQLLSVVKQQAQVQSFSFREIGSSLSRFFLEKTRQIILISFALSAIAVFVIFRSLVPSAAVLFGAVCDILVTLGVMGALQIPLTLGSVAALLMLIGFSLNTDNLLTIRVLKRTEDTPAVRAYGAMLTGFMMNFTSIAAFGVLMVVAGFLGIPTFSEIGVVAVIGSIVDFAATWAFNAPLIVWYAERRARKAGSAV